MELNKEQKKIILSKVNTYSVVKGSEGTGKTTMAVHRALYLKNNYCLYEDDNILIIPSRYEVDSVKNIYNNVEKENKLNYLSLFSNQKDKVIISNIRDIMQKYFIQYGKKQNFNILCEINQKRLFIKQCIEEVKKKYPKVKILKDENINFFIDEISWIKGCNYLQIEQYLNADRYGRKVKKGEGPQRLLKNSSQRKAVFEIMNVYNSKLKELNIIDEEDIDLRALYLIENNPMDEYTHIIIDGSENLTKVQLEFINKLCSNKTYSSIMHVFNNNCDVRQNAWLIKNCRINELGGKIKVKKFLLNKNIEDELCSKREEVASIKNYKYCDIRHNRDYNFMIDYSNVQEFIVNDDANTQAYSHDELNNIPVYNDIAAGQPILINSEMEGNFLLPKYWLKGMKDCFMLKVKGDSMIGANIEDGDYVVINKGYSIQNRDIVAVDLDGSATLKRLIINKDSALLMPENKKYAPIPINDGEAYFIGVAVGVIKSKDLQN